MYASMYVLAQLAAVAARILYDASRCNHWQVVRTFDSSISKASAKEGKKGQNTQISAIVLKN